MNKYLSVITFLLNTCTSGNLKICCAPFLCERHCRAIFRGQSRCGAGSSPPELKDIKQCEFTPGYLIATRDNNLRPMFIDLLLYAWQIVVPCCLSLSISRLYFSLSLAHTHTHIYCVMWFELSSLYYYMCSYVCVHARVCVYVPFFVTVRSFFLFR